MHALAKATIVIPLFIIVAAVIMRISNPVQQTSTNSDFRFTSSAPQNITPTSTNSTGLFNIPGTAKSTLDLQGPLACSHTDIDKDIKVFISKKRIYAKLKHNESIDFFLVNGDCAYKWKEGEKQGIKTCKIGQYLSLIESFSSMPFFSPELLFSLLPQIQGNADTIIDRDVAEDMMQSCSKQSIDEALFDLPRAIEFTEQKISLPPEDSL